MYWSQICSISPYHFESEMSVLGSESGIGTMKGMILIFLPFNRSVSQLEFVKGTFLNDAFQLENVNLGFPNEIVFGE